jgi:hypothetical protein
MARKRSLGRTPGRLGPGRSTCDSSLTKSRSRGRWPRAPRTPLARTPRVGRDGETGCGPGSSGQGEASVSLRSIAGSAARAATR